LLDFAEIKHWIALCTIEGIGPRRFVNLVEHFGSPGSVFSASEEELSKIPDVGKKLASNIKKTTDFRLAEKQVKLLEKNRFSFLTYKDTDYPENLKSIFDFRQRTVDKRG
jgi:DNA processing protein